MGNGKAAIEEVVKRVFTPHLLRNLKHKHKLWEEVAFRWQRVFKRFIPKIIHRSTFEGFSLLAEPPKEID